MIKTLKLLLGPMRLPFLLLTPACVLVGVGTAYWQIQHIDWFLVAIIFLGALASHIGVNAFNEYFDFKSGLDMKTKPTPFSGGSGTLPNHPDIANLTLYLAILSFILTMIVGLYLVWLHGWLLVPLGLIGLFLVVTYTIWWAYHPLLCLVAPGLGFGILMVMGTHFSLTGSYSLVAFIAALLPTFLVSGLLLLNQFPDVEADKSIGRQHFPIVIGRTASAKLYGVLLLCAYGSVVIGVITHILPIFCLFVLLTFFPAYKAYQGAFHNAENIPALLPAMGLNVMINLVTPVLLAIGFFMA